MIGNMAALHLFYKGKKKENMKGVDRRKEYFVIVFSRLYI